MRDKHKAQEDNTMMYAQQQQARAPSSTAQHTTCYSTSHHITAQRSSARTVEVVPHVKALWWSVAVAKLCCHKGLQPLQGQLTEGQQGQVVVGLEQVSLLLTESDTTGHRVC
jgi:hypothetical protein